MESKAAYRAPPGPKLYINRYTANLWMWDNFLIWIYLWPLCWWNWGNPWKTSVSMVGRGIWTHVTDPKSVTLAPGPRELGEITYMLSIWRPDYFRSKLCGFNTELIHAWTLRVQKRVIFSGNGMLQLDRGSLAKNLLLSLVLSWKWSCICMFNDKLYPNPQILQCLKILISTLVPILYKRWFCAISTDVMCV